MTRTTIKPQMNFICKRSVVITARKPPTAVYKKPIVHMNVTVIHSGISGISPARNRDPTISSVAKINKAPMLVQADAAKITDRELYSVPINSWREGLWSYVFILLVIRLDNRLTRNIPIAVVITVQKRYKPKYPANSKYAITIVAKLMVVAIVELENSLDDATFAFLPGIIGKRSAIPLLCFLVENPMRR